MKQAERERLGSYFSNPDTTAARRQALQAGDIDVATQIGKLDDETHKRATEEAKAVAPAAYQALKLPYEQRKAYLRSIAPQLTQVGFSADEIEAFDPSDAALNGILQVTQTLEQARSQDEWKYVTRQDGSQYAVDAFGRPVGDPTGRSSPGGGLTEPPAPAGAPGEFQFTPVEGAVMTSGLRTPEHNREVGGVANSYHLTGQARDFVPPPGMSMDELHAKLTQLNPGLDVINEGDHVHIEPKPGGQAGPSLPSNPVAKAEAIRAQAHEAIAAGADPEAVRARAASMGVSL